jgi:hypothetical protein
MFGFRLKTKDIMHQKLRILITLLVCIPVEKKKRYRLGSLRQGEWYEQYV